LTGPSILIVRLPCKKIYPIGPAYLASLIRQVAPDGSVRLLDLALVDPPLRKGALGDAIRESRPDAIAFSWRDVQVFSPQDMDEAMRDSFAFFYDPSLLAKGRAAFRGLGHIFSYRNALSENLSLIDEACRIAPASLVAVGGASLRVFGELLRPRISARARVITDPAEFLSLLGLPPPQNPLEPGVDPSALKGIFPEWGAYANEEIGVQSKRGCPNNCLYCLYGYLEGRSVVRREPRRVVEEIEGYHRTWGSERFWFVDAQLLSDRADDEHLTEILERLGDKELKVNWSGYMRIDRLKPDLAGLMVRTGLRDLEIALNSGAQPVVDRLRMGFSVEEVIEGLKVLKSAGYGGRIMIDLSLNSPGETRETLGQSISTFEKIQAMFSPGQVAAVVFFLAIQPHTALEKMALDEGHLKAGYDPMSVWPWAIRKLIYNPPPLGRLIGRCCAEAFRGPSEERGNAIISILKSKLGGEK
jgi:radical SAM superfamily enzyme YgiQ (UPF0313 family)